MRRPRDTRQIRARGSDLDDTAGILSAGQANLLDGNKAEARARVYPDGNSAVRTGGKGSRKAAIEIELHALCGGPAGAERPEGARRTLVDDLVSYT